MIKYWSHEATAEIFPIAASAQWHFHIDGLAQDCSNSIASALELLQSYA